MIIYWPKQSSGETIPTGIVDTVYPHYVCELIKCNFYQMFTI